MARRRFIRRRRSRFRRRRTPIRRRRILRGRGGYSRRSNAFRQQFGHLKRTQPPSQSPYWTAVKRGFREIAPVLGAGLIGASQGIARRRLEF